MNVIHLYLLIDYSFLQMNPGDIIPRSTVRLLDGTSTTLRDIISPNGIAVLNFGSCT